jgi:hypothetical protein
MARKKKTTEPVLPAAEVVERLADPPLQIATLLRYIAAVETRRRGLPALVQDALTLLGGIEPPPEGPGSVLAAYASAYRDDGFDDDAAVALLAGYVDALATRPDLELADHFEATINPDGERRRYPHRPEGADRAAPWDAPPKKRPRHKDWTGKPARYKEGKGWVVGIVERDDGGETLMFRPDGHEEARAVVRDRCKVLRVEQAAAVEEEPPATPVDRPLITMVVAARMAARIEKWLAAAVVPKRSPGETLAVLLEPTAARGPGGGFLAVRVSIQNGIPGKHRTYAVIHVVVAGDDAPGDAATITYEHPIIEGNLFGEHPIRLGNEEAILAIVDGRASA